MGEFDQMGRCLNCGRDVLFGELIVCVYRWVNQNYVAGRELAGYAHLSCTKPSDPSAKRVDTSPEHANETPESWHVDQPSDPPPSETASQLEREINAPTQVHTDGSGA